MAVVRSIATATSTTGGASVTTTSQTPLRGELLLLLVGVTDLVRPAPSFVITKSIAGGMGMVPVREAFYRTTLDSVYAFVGAGLEVPTARTYTITFPATTSGTHWSLYGVTGMKRTGLGAIRQVAIQNNGAAAGTPGPVFPDVCLTGNPVAALLGNGTNPAGLTPPAGFTESVDTGFGTPTSGFEAVFLSNGFTSATLTWGGTSASAFGAIAVEFDIRDLTASDVPQIERGWGGLQ
jgi:hypothetical protein